MIATANPPLADGPVVQKRNNGRQAAVTGRDRVVSFDLSTLPAGAQIQTAVLRMYQNADLPGGDSYADPAGLGAVLVDNISYSAFAADAGLFSADTTGTDIGIGPLATSYSASTWHELDVISSAKDEVNLYHNGRLQFRI